MANRSVPLPLRHNIGFRPSTSAGLYGNSRAAEFLRDVRSGADSLDIITIGDSNAGSPSTCGHTLGLRAACENMGMMVYATPLQFPASTDAATGNNRMSGLHGAYNYMFWTGNSQSGSTGTISTLEQQAALEVEPGSASDLLNAVNYSQPYALPTASNAAFSGSGQLRPCGFGYGAAYLASGSYTSAANGSSIRIYPRSPLVMGGGGGAQNLQYRLVYGTFTSGSGQFTMKAMHSVNTVVASKAVNTNSGQYGSATETLDFTSVNTTATQIEPRIMICAYDGYNTGSGNFTGPACVFWHSVIRKETKGFSLTNLMYNGGYSTTQIYSVLNVRQGLVKMVLKELRERQIAAGGSGRVLLFCNSGINGPDTANSWTTNAANIRDIFTTQWNALGYPANDLAFIFSVTHPSDPSVPADNNWSTNRPAIANAANDWGLANRNDGKNVVVFDIAAWFPASRLLAQNLYDPYQATALTTPAPYAAHLRAAPNHTISVGSPDQANQYFASNSLYDLLLPDNGYLQVNQAMVTALLSSI